MKSNYIDLVVTENQRVEVLALPAWSHAKYGDLITADGKTLMAVTATQTVSKDGADYNFAVAMNGGEIRRATTLYHAEELVWEEDEHEPVSE